MGIIMNNKSETKKKMMIVGSILTVLLLLISGSALLSMPLQTKALAYEGDEDIKPYIKFLASTAKANSSDSDNNTTTNTTTTTTPIPETAKGPAIPAKGYLVQEIRDHLYWVTDGVYNTMFLVTGKGVIAVDAPPSIGKNYLKAIAEVTHEPITVVIYSHAHRDHIGAAGLFPKNATYIAQEETAKILALHNETDIPKPTVTFTDTYAVKLGNQTLMKLDYKGINHERGNTFIYAPKERVLMLVDIIFPGWVPFKNLAIAEDVPGFIKAHDQALSYDFDTLVAGHLTRLGTRQDIITQKEFVSDLRNASASANKEVNFMDVVKKFGGLGNPWLVIKTYQDDVTNQCVQTMMPKWKDRLGGADSFMSDHCATMTESLRVD
jgi:glyoxylase-like metal-dependent hydrolase (beta-lactamase superfamily II)